LLLGAEIQPAVDVERLTGHPATVGGGEERDGIGDLVGLPDPVQRGDVGETR
jgi:hypothetical protein